MENKLVIVESPAKAKTIEKFLGEGYKVMSSYGHIRDLKQKEFSIDVEHDFAPDYIVPDDKKKLVSELKEASGAASSVLLASDEDREGEAISWHLAEVLGLDSKTTERIVFHEITKTAIMDALKNPRSIDMNLVNAQQARRILDRIVGFEVSPILWRKVKAALSAGRVQSVAVRLIVEREREIARFVTEASYRVIAGFILPDGETVLTAKLNKRLTDKKEALAFLESCKGAIFNIEDINTKPVVKSPAPPFTTSTLQQEAARKLGFSVSQTMTIAQRLYESGYITYMRTDSVNLSDLALAASKEAITNSYGKEYHKLRKYHTKSKGAQEAHEAIRPTYMSAPEISGNVQERRLYDLIFKRTIASQMADAQLERTIITVGSSNHQEEKFTATGEIITFDGFLHVYMESFDEDNDNDQDNGLLPLVNKNDALTMKSITATERFTQRPPRYTEASLVHHLEELGIGRPSTYAPTIQTIQSREYVIRGDKEGTERTYNILVLKNAKISDTDKTEISGYDRNKLMPTDVGMVVNDFLFEYFPGIMDYNFTARVEKEFDLIAEGQMEWTALMKDFYTEFHPTVTAAATSKTERKVGERQLGTDPKSGKPVFVKIGKYGPIAQMGVAGLEKKKDKPQFSPLMKGQSIETITLDEALKLFALPRVLGQYDGDNITAGAGRFGPYILHNSKFISLPKDMNPITISMDEAVELIKGKRKKEEEKHIKKFDTDPVLEILNGRFGPYISYTGINYKIPKGSDPTKLTLEECKAIIANTPNKSATTKRRFAKK